GPHVVRLFLDTNASAGAVANFNYFRFVRIKLTSIPTPKPAAPDDLTVKAISPSRIDLAWTESSKNATGFKIERALRGETYAAIARLPAGSTSYSDTGL